jgi:hypothetical protein
MVWLLWDPSEQLSKVKTLYKAKIDSELRKQVEEHYPYLLKQTQKKRSKIIIMDKLSPAFNKFPRRKRRGISNMELFILTLQAVGY